MACEKGVVTCWYESPINPIKPSAGVTERIPTVLPTGREGESYTCQRGAATEGSGNPVGTGKEGEGSLPAPSGS